MSADVERKVISNTQNSHAPENEFPETEQEKKDREKKAAKKKLARWRSYVGLMYLALILSVLFVVYKVSMGIYHSFSGSSVQTQTSVSGTVAGATIIAATTERGSTPGPVQSNLNVIPVTSSAPNEKQGSMPCYQYNNGQTYCDYENTKINGAQP